MAKDFGVSGDVSQTSSFWVSLCDLLAILNFHCQQLWRVTSRQQLDPRPQRKRLAVTGDVGNNAEAFVQWSFLIWVEGNDFSPLYFAITIESSNQPSCYKERKRSSSIFLSQWTVLKNCTIGNQILWNTSHQKTNDKSPWEKFCFVIIKIRLSYWMESIVLSVSPWQSVLSKRSRYP